MGTLLSINVAYGATTIAYGETTSYGLISGPGVQKVLVSASVTVLDTGNALLSATYASGTDMGDTKTWFAFDTDKNQATGWSTPIIPGVGVETYLDIYGSNFQGGTNYGPATYSGTTVSALVPLWVLSLTSGNDFNFMAAGRQQATTFSDYGLRSYGVGSVVPVTNQSPSIPEPATLVLALAGLGLAAVRVVFGQSVDADFFPLGRGNRPTRNSMISFTSESSSTDCSNRTAVRRRPGVGSSMNTKGA
jgi:hypothetical protein